MPPPDDFDLSPLDSAAAVVLAVLIFLGFVAMLLHFGERAIEELRAAVQG